MATLLSGGVDSSLLQYFINQHTSQLPPRSFSFAIRVPSFENEIKYARQSSQLFHTDHTFVDIQPEDFPGLLTRAIDILAQPPILAPEPSKLSIAELAQATHLPDRYFFCGQGADTVFGLAFSEKIKRLHEIGKIPGAARDAQIYRHNSKTNWPYFQIDEQRSAYIKLCKGSRCFPITC